MIRLNDTAPNIAPNNNPALYSSLDKFCCEISYKMIKYIWRENAEI